MTRSRALAEAMVQSGLTQLDLARVSGVAQPSVSQMLADRISMSDAMLDFLLACLGFDVVVLHQPKRHHFTRSSERRWRMHRRLAVALTPESLEEWRPTLERTLGRWDSPARSDHHRLIDDEWTRLVRTGTLREIRRTFIGLDERAEAMRERSPWAGILPEFERLEVLAETSQM